MKHFLLKTWLTMLCLLVGAGTSWAEKITDYTNIVSGKKYYIGATSSSTDYYLSVDGSSTSTSIAGTAVTDKSNATAFVFEGSGTSWTIKFDGTSNYLGLKSSKDNGKVQVVSSAATFTLSNQSSLIRLAIDSYSVQKNSSGTQFGSYGHTQTDVWLEEVSDGGGSGDGDGGEDVSASFIFNTDAGLSALGITKPAQSQGTNITSPITSSDITMSVTNGGTATRVWNSNGTTSLRVYSNGGSLTFSGATITQIVFTGTVPMTANVGSFSNKTWTGSASSVTFTATNGVTINTIVVTYESDGKTTPTLSFANPTYNATVGEDFTAPTLNNPQSVTVSYSSSETGVATVNASTGAISLVAPGATTITATFEGNEDYNEASASYKLVVAAPVQKYTISYATTENGTIVVKNGDTPLAEGAEVAEGTTLTIECTPTDAENYRFKNWQYKAGEAAWATRTSDFSYTMPSANVQFKANFEEIPTYTVTYMSLGSSAGTEQVKDGNKIANAPSVSLTDWTFVGWTTNGSYTDSETAPALFDDAITEPTTLYAVFSQGENGAAGSATLTNKEICDNVDGSYADGSITNSYGTWNYNASKQGNVSKDGEYFLQLRNNATVSYLQIPEMAGNITSIVLGRVCNTSKAKYTGSVYFRSEKSNDATAIATATQSTALTDVTLTIPDGYKTGYVMVSGACRIESVTVNYTTGGSKTYTITGPLPEGGTINFVATTGKGKYYATFSSTRGIKFDEVFVNEDESCFASVKAYAVAVIDGEILKTSLTDDYNDGNYTYIPANTGVLFEYILEDEYTFDGAVPFEYADAETEYLNPVEDNMLKPCPTTGIFKAEADGNYYYKLAYGDNTNQTKLGFWWGANDGSGNFKVKAGGAVLCVPQTVASNLRGFNFGEEETLTAIESITNAEVAGEIFNLQGQRIQRLQQGVNIVNGHKILR